MNLVGGDVLRQAVNTLRADIAGKPRPIVQSILTLQLLRNVDHAGSKHTLIDGCLFVSNKTDDATLPKNLAGDLTRLDEMQVTNERKVLLLSAFLIRPLR